uniref:Uncharacterized protein n=1 Tax=Anopheles culicifacies TaxID=139723 RepID=A0A182MQP2_9DIPT
MASKVEEIRGSIESSLKDESKPWTQFFKLAEEKTNVPRLYIFLEREKINPDARIERGSEAALGKNASPPLASDCIVLRAVYLFDFIIIIIIVTHGEAGCDDTVAIGVHHTSGLCYTTDENCPYTLTCIHVLPSSSSSVECGTYDGQSTVDN